MTVPTNLYQRDSLKGAREDLIDKIFNTSPTETPLTSSFGKATATSVFHEFQRDALGSANKDNAMIDGDDVTLDAQVATDRVGNHCQIFSKKPGVSRRANIVKKAGRGAEMAYIKAKAMLELKRDIEAMVVSNNVAVASTTSVAGKSGGLGVQLYTNTSHGGAGATASWTSGAPTAALTAGTNRTFTEALVKTVCQSIYANSGQFVEQMVMSPSHKAIFSSFTGIATNRSDVGKKQQATITGGIRREFQANFTRQGSGAGKWAPLRPYTLRDRAAKGYGAGPILVRSGRYRASFVQRGAADHYERITQTGIGTMYEVGSDDPRGPELELGRADMAARSVTTLDDGQAANLTRLIDFVIEQTERQVWR